MRAWGWSGDGCKGRVYDICMGRLGASSPTKRRLSVLGGFRGVFNIGCAEMWSDAEEDAMEGALEV